MKPESPDLLRVREIDQMGKEMITKEMLENWIGSDNMGVDSFLDLVLELVNETYPVDALRADVLEFAREEA
jgi:hypothetical protein